MAVRSVAKAADADRVQVGAEPTARGTQEAATVAAATVARAMAADRGVRIRETGVVSNRPKAGPLVTRASAETVLTFVREMVEAPAGRTPVLVAPV